MLDVENLIMGNLSRGLAKSLWIPAVLLALILAATAMPGPAIAIPYAKSRYFRIDFEPGTTIPTALGAGWVENARLTQTLVIMDRFELWGHGDAGQPRKAARKLADERMTVIARMLTSGNEAALPVVMHGNDGTIPIERPADVADPLDGTVEVYCGEGPSDQASDQPSRHITHDAGRATHRHHPSAIAHH